MKKFLILFAAAFVAGHAFADDFTHDGLKYTVTDEANKTVKVIPLCDRLYLATENYDFSNQSVTVPSTVSYNGTDYTVTAIDDQAFECSNLIGITLPSTITNIGDDAFCFCQRLYNVNLNEGLKRIGNETFCYCTSLVKLDLPSTLTTIDQKAFAFDISLGSIEIPEGVDTIGADAFCYCRSMTRASLPEGVNTIDIGAFQACPSLTEINIPEGVDSIGNYAFEGCSALKSVTLPSSLRSLGETAFKNCTDLESVTLPENLTMIGDGAFEYDRSLSSITSLIAEPLTINENVFDGVNKANCSLFVPEGSVSKYKSAPVWSDFNISANGTDAISSVFAEGNNEIVDAYSVGGIRLPNVRKGLNIVKMKDGTTRKIIIR